VTLGVSDGGALLFTEAARVNLPDYSLDDDNANDVPDSVELLRVPMLDPAPITYLANYCNMISGTFIRDLGERNDCDQDGVPDLLELQGAPPEERGADDHEVNHLLCVAEGYYTTALANRIGGSAFDELFCLDENEDATVASASLSNIGIDWLLGTAAQSYVGVNLLAVSVSAPHTFRSSPGNLPANRYWLASPDGTSFVELLLTPSMRFSTPPEQPVNVGHELADAQTFSNTQAVLHPLSATLLGNVPVGVDVDVEVELSDGTGAPVTSMISFSGQNRMSDAIGVYRVGVLGAGIAATLSAGLAEDDFDAVTGFFANLANDGTATMDIDYVATVTDPGRPLHGLTLRDTRRSTERYRVGGRHETSGSDDAVPIALSLVSPLSSFMSSNPGAPSMHVSSIGVHERSGDVLYLGRHQTDPENILSSAQLDALKAQIRPELDSVASHVSGALSAASWSVLILDGNPRAEIELSGGVSFSSPFSIELPTVEGLCDVLETAQDYICNARTGGTDFLQLVFRSALPAGTTSNNPLVVGSMRLQLGGVSQSSLHANDLDGDGVPIEDADTTGALGLPFSAGGRRGEISTDRQQVVLSLGTRARNNYQSNAALRQGANISRDSRLALDIQLSCLSYDGQVGGALFGVPPTETINGASVPVNSDSVLYVDGTILASNVQSGGQPNIGYQADNPNPGCLALETPILVQLPPSLIFSRGTIIEDDRVGQFDVARYAFAAPYADGSCPQPSMQEPSPWRADDAASQSGDRCLRVVLSGNADDAGVPTGVLGSPLIFSTEVQVLTTPGSTGGGVPPRKKPLDGGSGGGGAIDLASLFALLLLVLSLQRPLFPRLRHSRAGGNPE
jgi:hypothetical protein